MENTFIDKSLSISKFFRTFAPELVHKRLPASKNHGQKERRWTFKVAIYDIHCRRKHVDAKCDHILAQSSVALRDNILKLRVRKQETQNT